MMWKVIARYRVRDFQAMSRISVVDMERMLIPMVRGGRVDIASLPFQVAEFLFDAMIG